MEQFMFVQIGERYVIFDAESREDAEEQLENMSRADFEKQSVFKVRDSYWS